MRSTILALNASIEENGTMGCCDLQRTLDVGGYKDQTREANVYGSWTLSNYDPLCRPVVLRSRRVKCFRLFLDIKRVN